MGRRRRRALYYLSAILGVTLLYTLVYMYGMAFLEGEPRSFTDSLLVVIESFTTTGYGEDAPWASPVMDVLMVSMQLTGVFFIFMALPLFVAPWIEDRLSTSPPTSVEDGTTDHVVICAYTSRVETLIKELKTLEFPYVVIEPERDRAVDLMDAEIPVVLGEPDSAETLSNAGLADARALVADVDDETNASIVLTAEEVATEARIITFVENPSLASYHRLAGADNVFTPRQLIGDSLASKVTTAVSAEVGDAVEIGEDFEIVELPVRAGSEVVGKRVAESGIREQTGANIIGAWVRGEFESPPSPDTRIDEQTILLVSGQEAQVEGLKQLTLGKRRRHGGGRVIVGGHGEVGSTIKERIEEAGLPCVTIDTVDKPGVDIVGNVTDEETLREAGIDGATTLILALSDDTMTIFATLVARELVPDIEIIARADQTESVGKLYRAGADYVLALATVSGRMLASTILGEDVISFDQQVEVIRFDVGRLAGSSPAEADIRARTGCTVIAVERNGDVITDLDPDFEFGEADDLVVAGPDQSINEFAALFG